MAGAKATRTRSDIRSAFSVRDLQIFRASNGLPYAIMGHNPDNRLITDTWFGGLDTEDDFRRVPEFICGRFETGCYSYWLADLRYLNIGFLNSDSRLAGHVFPRVIATGLPREAVVLPSYRGAPPEFDVFGSASAALTKIADGRVRGFDDIEEARAWLFEDG